MKKVAVDNTNQLDLNTTARKNDKVIDKFSPYMSHMTYFVLKADLANQIGTFDEKKAMNETMMSIAQSSKEGGDSKLESRPASRAAADQSQSHFETRIESVAQSDAIYERMIIVIPYRSSDYVKAIEASFEKINIEALNLQNARYLSTKELSAEDKANRQMDFLGGFELIDREMRMFVLEGLSGCMNKFYLANEREHTNDRRFKMIYNPDIRFKNRLY